MIYRLTADNVTVSVCSTNAATVTLEIWVAQGLDTRLNFFPFFTD